MSGERHEAAAIALASYEDAGTLEDLDLTPGQVVPVGMVTHSNALVLLIWAGHPDVGKISWLDGEEIDRYDGFAQFAAMIECQHCYLNKLRASA